MHSLDRDRIFCPSDYSVEIIKDLNLKIRSDRQLFTDSNFESNALTERSVADVA